MDETAELDPRVREAYSKLYEHKFLVDRLEATDVEEVYWIRREGWSLSEFFAEFREMFPNGSILGGNMDETGADLRIAF